MTRPRHLLAMLVTLSLGTVLLWSHSAQSQSVDTFDADGPIYAWQRSNHYLPGDLVVLQTQSLAPASADTILRLFMLKPDGSVFREEAFDDDSGPGNGSRLTYTVPLPPAGGSNNYLIVVHASSSSTGGTCTLSATRNGNSDGLIFNLAFGGHWHLLTNLSNGELVQTAFEPNGAEQHQLLMLSYAGVGLSFVQGNGVFDSAAWSNTNGSYWTWAVVGALVKDDQPITLLVNDAPNLDSDGDGLGNDLEYTLNTCRYNGDTLAATPCNASNTADTDLDGLNDGWEVLGYDGTSEQLPLRLWGAEPLHKDVFVEVDYGNNTKFTSINPPFPLAQQWNDIFAREFQDAYGGTALQWANPDGEAGLRVHFDVEGSPWVSSLASAAVGNGAILFDGGGSGVANGLCDGGAYKDRRNDSMNVSRRSVFHYLCMSFDDGGLAVVSGLSARANQDLGTPANAHEVAHNLALHHGGDERFTGKPQHWSVMNYGYPGTAAQTLHGGAGQTYFSEGLWADVVLNPDSLCENDGVNPGPTSMVDTSSRWFFDIQQGGVAVDWNRDGTYSNCATAVTAPVTWLPSPNFTRNNTFAFRTARSILTSSGTIIGTPAIAAMGSGANLQSFVFYPVINSSGLDYIRYWSASFPHGECANPVTDLDSPCINWITAPYELSAQKRGVAVSASSHVYNGREEMFLAVTQSDGQLVIYRTTAGWQASGVLVFSVQTTLTNNAVLEADMAVIGGRLVVVWAEGAGPDYNLRWAELQGSGMWSTPTGVGFTTRTSPALAVKPGVFPKLHMTRGVIRPGVNSSVVDIISQNSFTKQWSGPNPPTPATDWWTFAKAGFGWKPYDIYDRDGNGGWFIGRRRDVDGNTHMMYFSSRTELWGRLDDQVGQGGIEILYDPRLTHLQAAFATQSNTIMYFPHAEGVYDHDLNDFDEFSFLRLGVCYSLKGQGCGFTLPGGFPEASIEAECP